MSKEMREQMDKFKNLLKEDNNMGNTPPPSDVPTAEDFAWNQQEDFKTILAEADYQGVYNLMIEFAKLHVQKALESASINLSETLGPEEIKRRGMDEIVIESYPLDNIQ